MTFGDAKLLTQIPQCKETERAAAQPSAEPCCVFKQQQERCTMSRDLKDKEQCGTKKLLHFNPCSDSCSGPELVTSDQRFRH